MLNKLIIFVNTSPASIKKCGTSSRIYHTNIIIICPIYLINSLNYRYEYKQLLATRRVISPLNSTMHSIVQFIEVQVFLLTNNLALLVD